MIEITQVTLPKATAASRPYIIPNWSHDRALPVYIDATLTKPRVRVRAPTERISMEQYLDQVLFDLTSDEVHARLSYWRRECPSVYETHDFMFVQYGIEPTIDDEIEMVNRGWCLGGYKGMRHFARPKMKKA